MVVGRWSPIRVEAFVRPWKIGNSAKGKCSRSRFCFISVTHLIRSWQNGEEKRKHGKDRTDGKTRN
jgi:hypothetical protein